MLKLTGLDEINKVLEDFKKKLNELGGTHSVPMDELLTPEFIASHTHFSTADEMFGASRFSIESQEDFEAIPDDQWDDFIRSVSAFPDWQAMLSETTKGWVARKLGF